MKLIVHVTKDNLTEEQAKELYEEIRQHLAEEFPSKPGIDPNVGSLHVNGQIVDKFVGSHETGHPGSPGEV